MITPIKHIKYQPIKYKLPKHLVYIKEVHPEIYEAKLFCRSNPKEYASLYGIKADDFIDNDFLGSFYIMSLQTTKKKLGLGSEMFKFAKNFSKQLGAEGRVTLTADPRFSKHEVPHIFYRKQGMNTGNLEIDTKLDYLIKKGRTATIEDFKSIKMYYPPIDYPKQEPNIKENFFEKTSIFFKIFKAIVTKS